MNTYQIFIHFLFGLMQCLFLYLNSLKSTGRPKLFQQALFLGILANGFRSIGYLKPDIMPYYPLLTPDSFGLMGNAVMFAMVFWSNHKSTSKAPNGRHERRMAIKEMLIGLGVVLALSCSAALYESNMKVAEKEEERAEDTKSLALQIRAMQAGYLMILSKVSELQDNQERFEYRVLKNQDRALKTLEKPAPKPVRKKTVIKPARLEAVEPKRHNFEVKPGKLPDVDVEQKPRRFKGNRRTGFIPFDYSIPKDSVFVAEWLNRQ